MSPPLSLSAVSPVAVPPACCPPANTSVRVGSAAWMPDDAYFTLVPGVRRAVRLTRRGVAVSSDERVGDDHATNGEVVVEAISALESIRIPVPEVGAPEMRS